MTAAALRVCPADDNELLAVEAFRLDPDPAVARSIGSVGALGDGALQPEPAGLRAKTRAVASDVIGVAQTVDFLAEQPLQPCLALDQRQFRRAFAVQEQQVEGEEDELISTAFVHSRLQAAEDRHAIGIERAKLTVDV